MDESSSGSCAEAAAQHIGGEELEYTALLGLI